MSRETVIIGDKEFAMSKIPAFQANGIILKLQKLVLPVIGEVAGGAKGGSVNLLEMDVRGAFDIMSSKLDESVMSDIVMPMFKLAQVACTSDNIKIDSDAAINKVFTVDTLGDMYELIFEVLKFNFGNFFSGLMARFGNNVGAPANQAQT